jgi:hypothetical protein
MMERHLHALLDQIGPGAQWHGVRVYEILWRTGCSPRMPRNKAKTSTWVIDIDTKSISVTKQEAEAFKRYLKQHKITFSEVA